MDPISTVQSALALAISIKIWLDNREEKEQVVRSVAATTARVCDVLRPVQDAMADEGSRKKLDEHVLSSFSGIMDVLCRIREHLIAWGGRRSGIRELALPINGGVTLDVNGNGIGKRKKMKMKITVDAMITFFVPSQVTKALRQDEQDLNSQLLGLMFVLAVKNLLKDSQIPPISTPDSTNQRTPPTFPSPNAPPPMYQEALPSYGRSRPLPTNDKNIFLDDSIQNPEVRQFWSDYIGAKVCLLLTKGVELTSRSSNYIADVDFKIGFPLLSEPMALFSPRDEVTPAVKAST